MKPERGQYRSITVVLLDGPDFQELPAEARWMFVCLKCSLGPCGIQVEYPASLVEKLAARSGYSTSTAAAMLDVLQAKGWVRAERNVVWAVGQLQAEPSLSPNNPNHKPTILSHIKGLPRLGIVGDFVRACRDYFEAPDELATAFPRSPSAPSVSYADAIPHPIPDAMGDQGKGKGQAQGGATSEKVTIATQSADAASKTAATPEVPHTRASVMGLVVERLYFGRRPPEVEMATNASILARLNRTHDWDILARVVEGLAVRRDRGELKSVPQDKPVSLKWVNDIDQLLNQVSVCEDAYYKAGNDPPSGKRGGKVTDISSIIGRAG